VGAHCGCCKVAHTFVRFPCPNQSRIEINNAVAHHSKYGSIFFFCRDLKATFFHWLKIRTLRNTQQSSCRNKHQREVNISNTAKRNAVECFAAGATNWRRLKLASICIARWLLVVKRRNVSAGCGIRLWLHRADSCMHLPDICRHCMDHHSHFICQEMRLVSSGDTEKNRFTNLVDISIHVSLYCTGSLYVSVYSIQKDMGTVEREM
jgi:hypothetical protein